MDDYGSLEKISFIKFHSVNVKGNWTHLTENDSQPRAKVNKKFRLSWKYLNCIIIKTFLKHLVCFEHQNYFVLFKVSF